jgi:GNAT superfamily N-acetyltransferase
LNSIIPDAELHTVLLNKYHILSSFSCLSHELNDFLKNDALNDQNNLISRTSLCFWNSELVGFYTLIADTIEAKTVTDGLEYYEYRKYPGVKIARLAVDSRFERRGIGTYLLLAAIGKTLSVCESIGCRYILVDSKKNSLGFYQKNEFKLVENYKNREFVPMYLNIQPIIAEMNFENNDKFKDLIIDRVSGNDNLIEVIDQVDPELSAFLVMLATVKMYPKDTFISFIDNEWCIVKR